MPGRVAYQGHLGDETCGAFFIESPVPGRILRIIASDGSESGWDHVSVSVATQDNRTPTWGEMEYVRRLFFKPEETVMQLHPPLSSYVNVHQGCLHLWRPWNAEIPLPPVNFV